MPQAVIVAGPNGSGKSTLIARLRESPSFVFPPAYINADDIARDDTEGSQQERERRAFRKARDLRQIYREQGITHAFETVLSHPSGLLDLQRLRDSGFDVTFVYVTTSDPKINVARVAGRVRRGGHDVPVDRISDRWHRSLGFLPRAVEIAHRSRIYDSTDGTSLAAIVEDGEILHSESFPFIYRRLVLPYQERRVARQRIEREAGSYLILLMKPPAPTKASYNRPDQITPSSELAMAASYATICF